MELANYKRGEEIHTKRYYGSISMSQYIKGRMIAKQIVRPADVSAPAPVICHRAQMG